MFTGIVQQKGQLKDTTREGSAGRLIIAADPWDHSLSVGESIAVNGVCLTLVEGDHTGLTFDVLAETFDKTNLGEKSIGDFVNLERALRYGDPIGGHIVSGHIDGTGVMKQVEQEGRDYILTVEASGSLLEHVIYKGSITLDGISLTVATITDTSFTVCIIPHTWEVTALAGLATGDQVNLEVDIVAKHIRKFIESGVYPTDITWESFCRSGVMSSEDNPMVD